jgi:Fic family protein
VLFATPDPSAFSAQLQRFDALRGRLESASSGAGPWIGSLRRQARVRSVQSSVAIEGFVVSDADASALVGGNMQPDPRDDDQMAVAAYAHAMDHVGVMASDPGFLWTDRVLLDLHFDACAFQRDRSPGRWRTDPVYVTSPDGGPPAFTGPGAEEVRPLMAEVVDWLERGDAGAHVAIRAAMAHLHLVSVHPFADGNGRLARIVQSLVLAREGMAAPELISIEEHLAERTRDYYDVLQQVQGGSYQPERDAIPWVRFCLAAHVEQAQRRISQVQAAAARWEVLEAIAEERAWPDRLVIALERGLCGGFEPAAYVAEAEVSRQTATSDLRRLLDAGLLRREGRTRTVRYVASDALRARIDAGGA